MTLPQPTNGDLMAVMVQMRVDRAASDATHNTRLDYIEKQLTKIDGINESLSEQRGMISSAVQRVATLEDSQRDQEQRLRIVESASKESLEHIKASRPLTQRFETLESRFYIAMGGLFVLEILLLPLWTQLVVPWISSK